MTDSHSDSAEQMLSIGATARILGVSVNTLRRWESSGKLAAVRTPGGQRRFRKTDVDALTGAKS